MSLGVLISIIGFLAAIFVWIDNLEEGSGWKTSTIVGFTGAVLVIHWVIWGCCSIPPGDTNTTHTRNESEHELLSLPERTAESQV